MGALEGLWLGLTVALSPANLAYCFLGVVLGTAVGGVPGVARGGPGRRGPVRDVHRRVPEGPAGTGRGGPRDVGLRLLHRRHVRGPRPDAHRPSARPGRPPLRPPPGFSPDRGGIDASELSRRDEILG